MFCSWCTTYKVSRGSDYQNQKDEKSTSRTLYVDFASILQSMNEKNKMQENQACSNAYHIVNNIPGVELERQMQIGLNAADRMVES